MTQTKRKPETPVRSTHLVLRPSRREIIEELKGEVRVYRSSYREIDGQVRNVAALHTIAALRAAIQIVKRQNTKLSGGGATEPQQQTEAESRRPLE
jgi:hypothetical protein